MTLGQKVFHVGVFGFYAYTSYFLVLNGLKNEKSEDFRVKFMSRFQNRYLTNWTYVIQMVYFFICVLGHLFDIVPGMGRIRNKTNSFGNLLFTTLAGPMAMVVTVFFWSLYIMDRELVYPKWIDQILPVWVNHAIHTANTVLVFLDICLVHHEFPSFSVAAKALTLYLLTYGICLYGTFFQTGTWLYPFLEELTWPQRGIMSIGNLLIAFGFYFVLLFFSKLVWGSKKEAAPRKQQKSKNSRPKSKKSA